MILGLSTLGDANIRKVLADPPLIWKVVAPDDPETYERSREDQSVGLLGRIFGKKKETTPRADLSLAEGEVVNTDLDKAWHGLQYMLTQTAWAGEPPLNFLVSGGSEVGAIDVGYGPARAFLAADVKAINDALRPIDHQFLKARFNPGEMMRLEIYPGIWDRDPEDDDSFGYCVEYLDVLKTFVADAAERGVGVIVTLV
jgi:hypothetical protein